MTLPERYWVMGTGTGPLMGIRLNRTWYTVVPDQWTWTYQSPNRAEPSITSIASSPPRMILRCIPPSPRGSSPGGRTSPGAPGTASHQGRGYPGPQGSGAPFLSPALHGSGREGYTR